METMTAGEAYDKAVAKIKQEIGNAVFTLVGWKSPSSGQELGPILITKHGNAIVEIRRNGVFKDAFPAKAEYYFPWIDIKK